MDNLHNDEKTMKEGIILKTYDSNNNKNKLYYWNHNLFEYNQDPFTNHEEIMEFEKASNVYHANRKKIKYEYKDFINNTSNDRKNILIALIAEIFERINDVAE